MSKYLGRSHRRERWRRVTRLMARDGDTCSICGGPLDRGCRDFEHDLYITFDHIVPRSLGGPDLESNLRLAHQICNNDRGNDPIRVDEENAA